MPDASQSAGAAAQRQAEEAALSGAVIEAVTTESGLLHLAGEWDAVLAEQPRPSPFLTWEWIYTWWQQFGGASRLWLLTARDRAGPLLGIAPLHVVNRRQGGLKLRSLEFLGYRGSAVRADHLDFLSRRRGRKAILMALIGAVQKREDWDVMVLADLADDSLLPELWRAQPACLRQERVAGETCYYLPLPSTVAPLWADLQAHHPAFAQNLQRYRRRLERRYSTRFVADIPAQGLAVTVEALALLHGLARSRHREASSFSRHDYRTFHQVLIERLAAKQQLYLARLECDGHIVAVLYGFIQAGVLYYYQSGFDTAYSSDGVGKLLLAMVLEDAVSRLGVREFDFLRGEEDYKTLWTTAARRTSNLLVWRGSLAGRLDRLRWCGRQRLRRLRQGIMRARAARA